MKKIATLLVMLFVLCGFEHSIANMFYFALGFTDAATYGKALGYILIAIAGNAIGGMLFAIGAAYQTKKQGE
jgi:formate/nitrite transporter FocA (FNT family)